MNKRRETKQKTVGSKLNLDVNSYLKVIRIRGNSANEDKNQNYKRI
jgi:hypothetical protein